MNRACERMNDSFSNCDNIVNLVDVNRLCDIIDEYIMQMVIPKAPTYESLFKDGSYNSDLWDILENQTVHKSSPGIPMMYQFQTNRQAFEHRELLQDNFYQRLSKLADHSFRNEYPFQLEIKTDSYGRSLVQNNLCDPVRMFIKNEPTTKDNPRIIYSTSLLDCNIDRFLFSGLAQANVDRHQQFSKENKDDDSPFTIGLDLNTFNSNKRTFLNLYRMYQRSAGQLVTDDISGYEYSFSRFMFFLCVFFLGRAYKKPEESWYLNLCVNRLICVMNPIFMSSDGNMLVSRVCILISGWFGTSFFGTLARTLVSCFLADRLNYAKANGDDCIECLFPEMEMRYKAIGIWLTDVKSVVVEDGFNFCSHVFKIGGARPEGYAKALVNLLTLEKIDEIQFRDFFTRYVLTGVLPHAQTFLELMNKSQRIGNLQYQEYSYYLRVYGTNLYIDSLTSSTLDVEAAAFQVEKNTL